MLTFYFSFLGVHFVFIFNLFLLLPGLCALDFINKFTDFALTVAILHDLKGVVFKNSKGSTLPPCTAFASHLLTFVHLNAR